MVSYPREVCGPEHRAASLCSCQALWPFVNLSAWEEAANARAGEISIQLSGTKTSSTILLALPLGGGRGGGFPYRMRSKSTTRTLIPLHRGSWHSLAGVNSSKQRWSSLSLRSPPGAFSDPDPLGAFLSLDQLCCVGQPHSACRVYLGPLLGLRTEDTVKYLVL